MNSDIKVLEIKAYFSLELARYPLKFGAVTMDRITYAQIKVKVQNKAGNTAYGYGSIFLSDVWAFPTFAISHEEKDKAMSEITRRFSKMVLDYKEFAHPVEIFMDLEEDLKKLTKDISKEFNFKEEMPFLAGLVSASPIDAALHDAFGNVNNISTYDGYSKDFMKHDISRWLGNSFKGKYISDYIKKSYGEKIPVFHLVGGLDKLLESEIDSKDPKDGLPVSLEKWAEADGLFCLKVKLRGKDLQWDVDRFVDVVKVTHKSNKEAKEFFFTVDTNEQCETPQYMIDFCMKVKEKYPLALEEMLYIEQPTERDLRLHKYDMSKLSKIKPVMIDESLISFEDFDLAMDLGWSGVALKVCKCHSSALLFMAKADEAKIKYTVQDLTNPGIALLQSAGFASRINTIKGVEANAHQFYPNTSLPEAKVHPGVFKREKGCLNLTTLKGSGFGYQMDKINRKFE
ncbi:MAG: hypothetical protein A2252_06750 [Elusimicrobia bacterium RIFOXYA2_FULL_39_19]|nr:MAG: hypothetical protein A2252_06750 [Elusimicrobia bacterium RIFOXYA2_FULL_39_19]